MKYFGLVVLSTASLLQGAWGACCRTNKCLKAVVLAGDQGLAECAAKLTVTVTPSASTVKVTVTAIKSTIATSRATVTSTKTASTATLLFTTTSTTIASTQTNVVSSTTTIPFVSTSTTTLPVSTSTVTSYSLNSPGNLKARQTAGLYIPEGKVPKYASEACDNNFTKYAKACRCAGVEVVTVTAPAKTVTYSVPGGTLTSVLSTVAVTQTTVSKVTATTRSTTTNIVSVTNTVTSTATIQVSSTSVVPATSTPPGAVATLVCQAPGARFRASVLVDTRFRWFNDFEYSQPAWQTISDESLLPPSSVWTLDNDGFLQGAFLPPGATEPRVAYVDIGSGITNPIKVRAGPASIVAAGVAAGIRVKVKGCINASTKEFTASAVGFHTILTCSNEFFLGSGDSANCLTLLPTARDA